MDAGIAVASPLEDYFLHTDDLEEPERSSAKAVTDPLLDVLGAEYATPTEGTAFYSLQSCANHSCAPNAHTLKVRCRCVATSSATCRRAPLCDRCDSAANNCRVLETLTAQQ